MPPTHFIQVPLCAFFFRLEELSEAQCCVTIFPCRQSKADQIANTSFAQCESNNKLNNTHHFIQFSHSVEIPSYHPWEPDSILLHPQIIRIRIVKTKNSALKSDNEYEIENVHTCILNLRDTTTVLVSIACD